MSALSCFRGSLRGTARLFETGVFLVNSLTISFEKREGEEIACVVLRDLILKCAYFFQEREKPPKETSERPEIPSFLSRFFRFF